MGQMHVIKAVMDPQGPSEILVTDLSDERLASLKHLVSLLCKGRDCARLPHLREPEGPPRGGAGHVPATRSTPAGSTTWWCSFPSPPSSARRRTTWRPNGVLNIFAGVKVGTITDLPLGAIVRDRMRVIGSSGSPLSAMRDTLALTESGKLSTSYSLAAVGDMGSAAKGLKALMDNTFTGKVVIFPFAHGIGLKSIKELAAGSARACAAAPGRPVLDAGGGGGVPQEQAFRVRAASQRHFCRQRGGTQWRT